METSMKMMSIRPSSSFSSVDSINEEEPRPPHEALFLALAYLPLFELLAMSVVCLSLRDAVNKDILPWLNIIFDRPLNRRLSDEILMKITSKANGRLTTLALINCVRITNAGLQRVIEKNPFIKKLYIPGCTGLSPQGVIEAVEKLSENDHTLEILHISGVYNITKEHLRTLHSHLKLNSSRQNEQKRQPILYHKARHYPVLVNRENDHSIDVEICPSCSEVRMVFDCSKQLCKGKPPARCCRGCYHCIPRCAECGGCIQPEEMEDAVCNDMLCSDCWLQLPKCNLCNKPYCRQHANLGSNSSCSSGFICDICQYQNQKCYSEEFLN
ncbi:F-box protein SKIP28 [Citrus sinensis]|nr:F-box protein SKIP28 [Citrus sinensis]